MIVEVSASNFRQKTETPAALYAYIDHCLICPHFLDVLH